MPEKTLGELKELAKPALRHAELIDIARAETPSSADTKASIRWPRRQAKATRFLAMLLRDYGPEALEAYLLEHARAQDSEHAQGVPMLTLDSVYPVGVQHLHFTYQPGWESEGLDALQIAEFRVGWSHQKNAVLVKDEIARLSLDERRKEELVLRVIESMFASHVNPDYVRSVGGDMWAAALVAVRTLLPDDKTLYRRLLLTTVHYMGSRAEHPMSFARALGANPSEGMRNNAQTALQCVIDYLLEQGCSETEVSKAWADMLDLRSKQGYHAVLVSSWWSGLKIGKTQVDGIDEEIAEPAARRCVHRELRWFLEDATSDYGQHYDRTMEEGRLCNLESMIPVCGSVWRNNEGREMFEDMLATCLARGQAGKAFYFFTRFGHSFCLHQTADDGRWARDAKSKFIPLVRGAIDKAKDEHNFGIASALAEYVSEATLADELRERARHLSQPIVLDFMFYVFIPRRLRNSY